uniref:Uncharacterized protein n=1 Tax=Arundo donax TaxID=35708 RepID=A0A0A9H063_ARUDO
MSQPMQLHPFCQLKISDLDQLIK